MADNDELEYYDDDDIRDQIPDDDGLDEGEGERPAPPTPVRPLQTSSRQPAARPPARPPRPAPRRPQDGPSAAPASPFSSGPPAGPARRTPASASPPPQDWPAADEPEYQPRIVHSRPGEPLRDLSPPPAAPEADTPGRLARLLRRGRRQDTQPAAPRPGPLQALRARLPAVAAPGLLGNLAGRARGAWRLALPARREQEPPRRAGGARRRRRKDSKAPRLGGSGLTLDNKLDILGVLLVLASLALFLSSLSTIRGQLTQVVNTFLGNFLGWGALAVPLLFFAVGAWLIVRHFGSEAPVVNPLRVAGGALFFVGLLLFFQFVDSFNPGYSSIDLSDPVRLRLQLELAWNAGRGGGYAGAELYYLLVTGLGEVGMLVSTTGMLLIGAMFALQISVADLAALISRGWRRLQKARERRARQREEQRQIARAAALQARATGAVVEDDGPRSIPITMGGRTVKAELSEQEAGSPLRSGLRALSPRLRAGIAALVAARQGAGAAAAPADGPASPAPAAAREDMAPPQGDLPAPAPAAPYTEAPPAPAPPPYDNFPVAPPAGPVTAPADEERERPPQVLPQRPVAAEATPAATAEETPPRIPPSPTSMRPTLAAAPRRRQRDWQLPDLSSLLNVGSESDLDREILLGRARTIEETLQSFGSPGRVVEVNTGPVITQFGVEPDYLLTRAGKKTRVKVGAIAQLDKDLQLALGAKTIRIEAPVPGKGYVGIEVPNAQAAVVSLRDVMESEPFHALQEEAALAIGLGQSVDGTPVAADLAGMPHLLIAGTTGSGKSVLVNAIIVSLLVNNTPDRLRFIMVDPKRVELTSYNGVPHLVAPVVVDLERTLGVLKWVTREMDERYRRFSEAGARNIEDYNRHLDGDLERMPYIVVVIDELADLMMLAPDETERVITRIAALARATGIHLVIATQRPSVDVVTGLIKANFPARIAFAVAGGVDSRVILDQPGAERLLGKGDMLYLSGSAPAAARLQGVLVSPEEVDKVTGYWKRQALDEPAATPLPDEDAGDDDAPAESPLADMPPLPAPAAKAAASQQAHLAFPDFSAWNEEKGVELHERVTDERDELYEQAVEMVRRLNKASVSLLQRRMRIGYTRAARLIDMMEDEGVIGPAQDGSKPREVLPE